MKKKTKKTLEESTVVSTNPNLDANITTIVENNNSAFTDYEVGPTIENTIDSKLTKVKNKINAKMLKNKTVGVKFWYDGIPDKKIRLTMMFLKEFLTMLMMVILAWI